MSAAERASLAAGPRERLRLATELWNLRSPGFIAPLPTPPTLRPHSSIWLKQHSAASQIHPLPWPLRRTLPSSVSNSDDPRGLSPGWVSPPDAKPHPSGQPEGP